MNLWPRHERSRTLAAAFAGGATLLCASLANLLHDNEYPLLRQEVGLMVAAILALSGAMAVFYSGQRQWGRSFLEGLLVVLFADLNTESLPLALVAGAAVALVTWFRRVSLLGPMAIIGLVVLGTTIAGIGGNPHWIEVEQGAAPGKGKPAASDKPAIVHLILDEHIGVEGLPNDAQGLRLRGELRRFYLANGFAVYGGAYSQHLHTINAMPHALNYGRGLASSASKRGAEVGPTQHLQRLIDQGYRLTILQSRFVDYCVRAKVQKCITYDASDLRPTLAVPMDAPDRTGLITLKFLARSGIFLAAAAAWNDGAQILRRAGLSLPMHKVDSKASSTVGTLEAIDVLSAELKSARPGDAIFAHLLLPHYPYVVRRDCTYLPWGAWESLTGGASVEVRRRAYDEQLRCTIRKLAAMLRALSQSPAGRSTVVVIHGDHGSRITHLSPVNENFGRIGDADMVAGFSTLFVVRAPAVLPAYFPERQPIVALLRDFAASGFRSAPHPNPPSEHMVYLANSSDWKTVRAVPLPESWTKPVAACSSPTRALRQQPSACARRRS